MAPTVGADMRCLRSRCRRLRPAIAKEQHYTHRSIQAANAHFSSSRCTSAGTGAPGWWSACWHDLPSRCLLALSSALVQQQHAKCFCGILESWQQFLQILIFVFHKHSILEPLKQAFSNLSPPKRSIYIYTRQPNNFAFCTNVPSVISGEAW